MILTSIVVLHVEEKKAAETGIKGVHGKTGVSFTHTNSRASAWWGVPI